MFEVLSCGFTMHTQKTLHALYIRLIFCLPDACKTYAFICIQGAKQADKPGSVADDHLSWRTRCRAALRTLPGRRPGRPIAPLFALAPDGVYQAAALPRRWWSLTPPFQLFPLRAESARRWESSFLRHFPSDCSAWPLASILPCGARTFLTPAPRHGSRDRLARFARGIVASAARDGAPAPNPHDIRAGRPWAAGLRRPPGGPPCRIAHEEGETCRFASVLT